MRTSGSGLESLFVCPYRLVTAVSQAAKRDKRRVRLGLRAISAILSDFHLSPGFRTFYTQPLPFVPSDLCFRLGSCRNGKRAHRKVRHETRPRRCLFPGSLRDPAGDTCALQGAAGCLCSFSTITTKKTRLCPSRRASRFANHRYDRGLATQACKGEGTGLNVHGSWLALTFGCPEYIYQIVYIS